MKALFISGGATKFIGLISAAHELMINKGYKPQLIFGVSSGAITAILAAMNMFREGIDVGTSLTLDTIFSEKPINRKGKVTLGAIWKLIRGKNYLGKMDNLEKMLRITIPKELFEDYRKGSAPAVGVLAVNAQNSSRKMFMLKELDYDQAIKAIMASATIPGAGQAVEIDGAYYYDGGVRDHSPGGYALTRLDLKLKEAVAIYSRPEKDLTRQNTGWDKNVLELFNSFVIPTFNIEVSKNDYEIEKSVSEKQGIRYTAIFIEKFVDELFDVDPVKLADGYEKGVQAVKKYYKPGEI